MVIITTTPTLEGMPIKKYCGIINTNIVIGTNFFSDFAASFTDVFGGSSGTYRNKMNSMYVAAKKQMEDKALRLGANAIVGYHTDFDEISGKGKSMFMLSVSGTACIVEERGQSCSEPDSIDSQTISSEKLTQFLKHDAIISKVDNGKIDLSDEDWDILYENASINNVELLVSKLYGSPVQRPKVERYLSLLEREDVIPIVYKQLYKSKLVYSALINGVNQSYIIPINELIKKCKLFDASELRTLFNEDFSLFISVLDAEKDFYTKADLDDMKELSNMISQLPEKGSFTRGKLGMFGKEEEIWICPNGHKNSKEDEFCSTCNLNIKGIVKADQEKVEAFEKKLKMLESLLK